MIRREEEKALAERREPARTHDGVRQARMATTARPSALECTQAADDRRAAADRSAERERLRRMGAAYTSEDDATGKRYLQELEKKAEAAAKKKQEERYPTQEVHTP